MNQAPSLETTSLALLNIIRTETVLTRTPIHRLAKKGNIDIELRDVNEKGEVTFNWEVTYTKKYGQPGPLAYKIDTLVVNRKLEKAGKPTPKVISIGSLNEMSDSGTRNTNRIKKALHQNASAYITAKIRYKGKDGTEHRKEFGGTRYVVVFTGERLPDGREADAVYIVLHDWYRETLDTAPTRPLDYDYLRDLSPAAQRLYELLSFHIYGTLTHKRPRARLLYSDFCTYAPQTRYYSFEQVKKQMYKLHVPHRKSGYIAEVEFRETTDSEGRADWEMLYTPGRKAKAEFRAFNELSGIASKKRKKPEQLELPPPTEQKPPPAEERPAPEIAARSLTEGDDQLIKELLEHGVHFDTTTELVSAEPEEVRRQLEYLPYRMVKKNKAGLLRDAIVGHWTPPDEYLEFKRKEQEQRENQERLNKKAAEAVQAAARQQDEERQRAAYFDYLRIRVGQIEQEQPAAYRAFLDDTAAKRAALEADPAHKGAAKKIYLRLFDDEESHLERFREYFGELTLEAWDRTKEQ